MSTFLFFGTPYVARDTLALLVERGFTPEAVITSPDAPSGRGLTLTPSPTKEWAEAHGLPVHTPEKLDVAEFAPYGADFAIVVAYGKILPKAFIEAFPKGVLNVHYSLLPKYRGASPVEAALRSGDTETGVTIQRMVYALDAGDIVAQRSVAIDDMETARELKPRLIQEGAELLVQSLPGYLSGSITPVPQDESQATHCGKIDKAEGELNLSGDPRTNWNTYRAFAESPGTYFFMERNGKRMRVKIVTAMFADGAFVPLRVVPEGKKEMDYATLIR